MTGPHIDRDPEDQSSVVGPSKPRLLSILGPGLITGASDDDPSGIATYSQAGAQFGYALSWTMIFTYPLMVAIQIISARLGRTTGHGIAGVLRLHYSSALLQVIVALLLIANVINIGADLGAMAESLAMLVPAPHAVYILLFGAICIGLQVFLRYARYVSVLKWLTLVLLAYFIAVAVVHVAWGTFFRQLLIPHLIWHPDYLTTLVAILGTTISPYLFFWQASEEVEDLNTYPQRTDLIDAPEQAPSALRRIRVDTMVGMAVSNLVALSIITTTAATLNAQGITEVASAATAAKALLPVAGPFAYALFTLGIVGTGFLAVPVLAGSAAYAVGEARSWPTGLGRRPREARAFYGTLVVATLVGMVINFLPINPIRALYWSAVINGVIAVPIMIILMLAASRADIMGKFVIGRGLKTLGWVATVVMGVVAVGMFWTFV